MQILDKRLFLLVIAVIVIKGYIKERYIKEGNLQFGLLSDCWDIILNIKWEIENNFYEE